MIVDQHACIGMVGAWVRALRGGGMVGWWDGGVVGWWGGGMVGWWDSPGTHLRRNSQPIILLVPQGDKQKPVPP